MSEIALSRQEPDQLTIDELARLAGITTRNVRAYQSRDLLPAPRIVGRVGYYGSEHLARLELIGRLQDRGFSLAAIGDLLRAWDEGSSIKEMLGLEEALTAPWSDEAPETVSREQLEALFPEAVVEPELIARGVELGILVPDGEDFRVPSPTLLRHGSELTGVGIPLGVALDMAAIMKAHTEAIAGSLVETFTRQVWAPAFSGKVTEGSLAKLIEALQRTRPMAFESIHIFLARAMDQAVAAALAAEPQCVAVEETGEGATNGAMRGEERG